MAGPESSDARTTIQPSQAEWVDQDPTPVPHSVNGSVNDAREHVDVPAEHRTAVLELLVRHGDEITQEDAARCVAWAATKARTNLAGYVARFTAEEVRARAGTAAVPPRTPAASSRWCPVPGHRGAAGVDADGDPRCGDCANDRADVAS
jgi:hypothetical protein